jgi:hypothetical protein
MAPHQDQARTLSEGVHQELIILKGTMTTYIYPDIPEFILDHIGNEVRPGDFIVYAVRNGDTAAMRSGFVQNFQYPKDQKYSYNAKILKIKVKDPITEKTTTIEQSHKRFAKVILPDN